MDATWMDFLLRGGTAPHEREHRAKSILGKLIRESRAIDQPNFTCVEPRDLQRAFQLYDDSVFGGRIRGTLAGRTVEFRFSRRMTSVGGQTARYRDANQGDWFRISLSSTLLFNSFHDVDREVVVNGLPCDNRLDAMLRIFEHELLHLVEMITWGDSSCAAPRYQGIANRFFGHLSFSHQLVTPRERAFVKFGIRPGDDVVFRFDGRELKGRVNLIRKRATVLVEDASGAPYSDGRRYQKFYVPINLLRRFESESDR
ncbi:MAG: hypothetical protein FJ297_09215 [Planctomycetes bacterium]|nr:hypothetical protein [Planctomycetota bacterium]